MVQLQNNDDMVMTSLARSSYLGTDVNKRASFLAFVKTVYPILK